MKILHIITRLDRGGSAEVVLDLAHGLKRAGHEVFIAVGPTLDPQTDIAAYSEETGVHICRAGFLRRNINPLWDMPALFEVIGIIRRIKPDVLHTHTSKAGFIGRIAGKIAGIRVIVHTPHGHVFYGYFRDIAGRIFVVLERVAARFSDRIITLTDIEKEEYVIEGIAASDKLVSMPCGIDVERFFSNGKSVRTGFGIAPDVPVVGWVGRLEPVKGCEIFLKACRLISREFPAARYLVVGEGPLRRELEALAFSLGLEKETIFTGYRKDMPDIMNSIDLLVHTPLNEGLGKVLLEAMACSKPIVATSVGGIPEIITHGTNGHLVPSGDFVSVACESVKVLKDRDLSKRLGEAGRRRAMSHGSGQLVEKTDRLYAELSANGI